MNGADPNDETMVPLRCQSCGGEVGLRSPGPVPDPAMYVVRCYACAATEAAERITAQVALPPAVPPAAEQGEA